MSIPAVFEGVASGNRFGLLRTDYRGVVTLVGEWSELREVLGLARVPHYSTLAYASRRILADGHKKGLSTSSRQAWENEPVPRA